MTRRSLELIASADVILYDRLIPPGALAGARADADLRYVGKTPGEGGVRQEEIESLLVELARDGRSVVRLMPLGPPVNAERRRKLLEAVRAAGAVKAHAGESAARSQDFLYGTDGLSG